MQNKPEITATFTAFFTACFIALYHILAKFKLMTHSTVRVKIINRSHTDDLFNRVSGQTFSNIV